MDRDGKAAGPITSNSESACFDNVCAWICGALRTFVAVAEYSSFSRAAEELHLAQPAVSQQVKRLERDVGAELLSRSTRRVQLTPPASACCPARSPILADVDRAEDEIRMLEAGLVGPRRDRLRRDGDLRPPAPRRPVGPRAPARRGAGAVRRAAQPRPGRRPARATARHRRAARPGPDPASPSGPCAPSDWSPPAGRPSARRRRDGRARRAARLDLRHASRRGSVGRCTTRSCRRAGASASCRSTVVEVRETATLVAFVAAGIGVALVPEPVRSLALEGVVFRPLTDVDQMTDLALATRAHELPATVAHVVDVIDLCGRSAEECPP